MDSESTHVDSLSLPILFSACVGLVVFGGDLNACYLLGFGVASPEEEDTVEELVDPKQQSALQQLTSRTQQLRFVFSRTRSATCLLFIVMGCSFFCRAQGIDPLPQILQKNQGLRPVSGVISGRQIGGGAAVRSFPLYRRQRCCYFFNVLRALNA